MAAGVDEQMEMERKRRRRKRGLEGDEDEDKEVILNSLLLQPPPSNAASTANANITINASKSDTNTNVAGSAATIKTSNSNTVVNSSTTIASPPILSSTSSSGSGVAVEAATSPPLPPKRIALSDMDTSKYMTFGSLFILAVDTLLFPLDTLKTIIMSDRIKKVKASPAASSVTPPKPAILLTPSSSPLPAPPLPSSVLPSSVLPSSASVTSHVLPSQIGSGGGIPTSTPTPVSSKPLLTSASSPLTSSTASSNTTATSPKLSSTFSNPSKKTPAAGSKQNVFRMAWTIARREGIMRFWRGVVPSTIGNFPGQASYYLAYESAQEAMTKLLPNGESKVVTFTRGFVSGMAAEVAGGIFYVPADIVAQRLQIQSVQGFVHNSRLYSGPLDVVTKIVKAHGPWGLYRGYGAYVTAYAPGSAVQWGSYEVSKGYMFKCLTWLENQKYIPDHIPLKEQYVNALSAAISATCAITSNNPLEILRIRTQLLESNSKRDAEAIKGGYLQLARTILREEGWSAFYRGLRIRLFVTVPSAMVALSGYEVIKQFSEFK